MTRDLSRLLAARLGELGHDGVRVRDLVRLSGGASRETWSFTAETTGGPVRLILRRDPPTEPRPEIVRREAIAVAAAHRHGVPSPQLLDWSADPDRLGAGYLLLTHVDGETIARRILRDDAYTAARGRLAADLGRAAALVHGIPAGEIGDIPLADGVAILWDRYLDAGELRPVFELAFQWLEDTRPARRPAPALVHGDYRLGNVIVDERGLAAVLDWELVHRGDPMEDLGYLCIRAWRFGGPRPVAGVGSFTELFDAYEDAGGGPVDPGRVRWWQIAGTLNWGVSCLQQANRHLRGHTRSVELAAVGRRVAEQEHDLLRLLDAEGAR